MIDFPPNADQYPEHDHAHDSQEEVYTVLDGAATLQAGGEEHELRPGTFARVGPGEKRKLVTGAEGARVIALGGMPGKAYEVSAPSPFRRRRPPADRLDLGIANRVALVMGASKGIGRATARALAREGARVAVASRSPRADRAGGCRTAL